MYKIIGADGKEYGPITADQLRQWMTEGRVNDKTQVQAEGSTEWKPLGLYPEFVPVAPLEVTAGAAEPSIEEIAARDYRIEIGDCISDGWKLLKANFGLLVGGTMLVFLLLGVLQLPFQIGRMMIQFGHSNRGLLVAGGLLSLIGMPALMILSGPIKGGLYWPYLLRLRGQPAEIGDFFAGFSRGFVNLMLLHIVMGLLMVAVIALPAIVFGIGAAIHFAKSAPGGIGMMVVGGALLLVTVPIMIYLAVCWFFTLPLAVDKRLGFWNAMKLSKRKVSQHWWQVFGLTFVAGLVGASGIILCCIGIVLTMPIALAIAIHIDIGT